MLQSLSLTLGFMQERKKRTTAVRAPGGMREAPSRTCSILKLGTEALHQSHPC